MPDHPDVVIVGGGVIGLTTAYFLAREGVQVEVLDKGDFAQEASWAGAGILAPGNPEQARSPYDKLRGHSAVLFPRLSAELADVTGIDNGYLCCGGLEFLCADTEQVEEEWIAEGIAFDRLDACAVHELEPALAVNAGSAYVLPDMSQVRNPRHLKALLAACAARGVRLRRGCPVHSLERREGKITGVQTSQGIIPANRFLIASGAWTDPLLQPLGLRPGIHPVRGQIALLHCGVKPFTRVIQQGHRYLVPRPDGRVLAGSTEENAGFDKRSTAAAIGNLLEFAVRLVPQLGDATLERSWAGLRPGTPDRLPFLGPVPDFDNLFIAAGHFRTGINLSPATALVVKECLLDQPLTVPLDSFRLDRAAATPHRPAFRS